jgi:hypothetical protein
VLNYVRCGIFDKREEDKGNDAMAGLIPYYSFKMRFILKFCVDKNWEKNVGRALLDYSSRSFGLTRVSLNL